MLHWEAKLGVRQDVVELELEESTISIAGLGPQATLMLLKLFDGRRSLGEAARLAHVPVAEALALAWKLVEAGAAAAVDHANRTDAPCIDPAVFAMACRALHRKLRPRIERHVLIQGLNFGQVQRQVFLGWLIENYHFIEGVNDRLAAAVAACDDRDLRPLFVKHYIEEWDHSRYFMTALNRLGIPRARVLASQPLPGTLAVLNHMRDAARRDPLQYVACSGFLESTGEDRDGARIFFDRITEHYANTIPEAIQPLADHMQLDGAYQHDCVVENVCAKLPAITPTRASGALQSAVTLVETIEVWLTDILRFYDKAQFSPHTRFATLRRV